MLPHNFKLYIMEKQLTAVEWLHEQFKAGFNYNIEEGYEKRRDELFEEAKQMEEDGKHASYLYGHEVGFTKAMEKLQNIEAKQQEQ